MEIKRKGGLGKGLSAILSSDVQDIKQEATIVTNISLIAVGNIETNPFQPRTEFEAEALQELADSIKVHGIIQPLTVRKLADNQYQLIAGERRLRASKLASLAEVPAYIRTANDEQMIEMALIENIQRQDLNPIEVALSYKRMMEELGLKQEELGEKVGKNRTTVANFVRLLRLSPEIQIGIRDGKITMGHAKPLISLENAAQQLATYHEILFKDLSVRQTEQRVRDILNPPVAPPKKEKESEGTNHIFLRDIQEKMEDKLGNKVQLVQNEDGKGEIKVTFSSTDDLNRMLEILAVI